MEPPGLGALDVLLAAAAASETAMVLHPLHREDVLTAAAAAPAGPVTAEATPPPVLTVTAFNSGGDLRRPDPMMCWGGSFLADSSCTALIFFTTDPFDQSLVTTCWKGRGEEVPTAIASGAKGVAAPPRPLRLGTVAVDATAETPLLGRPPRAASKSAFLFPLLVGMATRINAELWMMAQNGRRGNSDVAKIGGCR
jgi:hypothetical protein